MAIFSQQSDDDERDLTREARLQYDPQIVRESQARWGAYDADQRAAIMDEGNAIYADLAAALEEGKSSDDEDVQRLLARWHEHLRHFYEPSFEILRGLASLYVDDPRFADKFTALHPDLPAFLQTSITQYVDVLETAAIQQMLDDDAERRGRLS